LFNIRRLKPAVNHILLYEQQGWRRFAIGAFIRSSLRSHYAHRLQIGASGDNILRNKFIIFV